MRYVFLDVDGVLNNRYTKNLPDKGYIAGLAAIDFANMDAFKALMDLLYDKYGKDNIKIILSSSWRAGEDIKDSERFMYSLRKVLDEYLEKWGLSVDAECPILPYEYSRGAEIADYLSSRLKDLEGYIVLDDCIFEDFKDYYILRHLIQSCYDTRSGNAGFRARHIKQALRFMAKPVKEDELESLKNFRVKL